MAGVLSRPRSRHPRVGPSPTGLSVLVRIIQSYKKGWAWIMQDSCPAATPYLKPPPPAAGPRGPGVYRLRAMFRPEGEPRRSRLARAGSVIALASLFAAVAAAAPRVVAVGDVHGDLTAFRAILKDAGLVDDRGAWTGGDAVLVQTGDLIDRGPSTRGVLDFVMALEKDAAKSGGSVVVLLGNHEVMNMTGDLRYVAARELRRVRGRRIREAPRGRLAGPERVRGAARGRAPPARDPARTRREERVAREAPAGILRAAGGLRTGRRVRPLASREIRRPSFCGTPRSCTAAFRRRT